MSYSDKNIFTEKKIELDILEDLNSKLIDIINNSMCNYEEIGTEQATDWRGDFIWEDEECTVPKIRSVYGYVEKESVTEYDKSRADAAKRIQKKLESFI